MKHQLYANMYKLTSHVNQTPVLCVSTYLEHHVNLAARRHGRHGAAGRDETVATADADGGA